MDTKSDFDAWRATALLRLVLGVLAFGALFGAEDPRPSLAPPGTDVAKERSTQPDQLKPGW